LHKEQIKRVQPPCPPKEGSNIFEFINSFKISRGSNPPLEGREAIATVWPVQQKYPLKKIKNLFKREAYIS